MQFGNRQVTNFSIYLWKLEKPEQLLRLDLVLATTLLET